MSISRSGVITRWNDAIGQGLIKGDTEGVYAFSAADCADSLQGLLRGTAIPPNGPVHVTFDLDFRNRAINVSAMVLATPDLHCDGLRRHSFHPWQVSVGQPCPSGDGATIVSGE